MSARLVLGGVAAGEIGVGGLELKAVQVEPRYRAARQSAAAPAPQQVSVNAPSANSP